MNDPRWKFNPFELAFVGYKNSGKTTLMAGLVRRLKDLGFGVGYLKHDVHGFEIDHPGKDTHSVAQAGASHVFISDANRQAILKPAPEHPGHLLDLLEPDLLLVEGYKGLPLPRLALLDPEGRLLADENLKVHPPLAVVHPGPCPDLPWDVPRFHRDDQEGILSFLLARMRGLAAATPLHGLVLTGGCSTRMGRDKAQLGYGGVGQVDRALALLGEVCGEVFVSCRAEQAEAPGRQWRPQIHDILVDQGPVGGILSALQARPDAAWLVLACDLPYLNAATLRALVAGRQPFRFATAFRGHQALPEPLCTIYEPKCRPRFWQFMALGHTYPRQLLVHSPVALLEDPGATLSNVNTPKQHADATEHLGA